MGGSSLTPAPQAIALRPGRLLCSVDLLRHGRRHHLQAFCSSRFVAEPAQHWRPAASCCKENRHGLCTKTSKCCGHACLWRVLSQYLNRSSSR